MIQSVLLKTPQIQKVPGSKAGPTSLLLLAGSSPFAGPFSPPLPDLQVRPLLATPAGGSPPAASQGRCCSQSGSRLELYFPFLLQTKMPPPVCPIGLAVPDVSGVGSCKAAQPRGSSTALHNGRVHVTFPLVLDCSTQSFGDVLKFSLLQSQERTAQQQNKWKERQYWPRSLGSSVKCVYPYFVLGRL